MIDYQKIHSSFLFYESKGFLNIETPWTVTESISGITKPPAVKDFKLVHDDNKVLVASGEQGFLYMYNKGFLPLGRFQTTTPCFRKEAFGPFHTKYFVKTELIDTKDVSVSNLETIVDIALGNFIRLATKYSEKFAVIDTTYSLGYPSFDIELNGIEVGSYGIRGCEFLNWVYGTGIAEPRFTKVLNSLELKERYNGIPR